MFTKCGFVAGADVGHGPDCWRLARYICGATDSGKESRLLQRWSAAWRYYFTPDESALALYLGRPVGSGDRVKPSQVVQLVSVLIGRMMDSRKDGKSFDRFVNQKTLAELARMEYGTVRRVVQVIKAGALPVPMVFATFEASHARASAKNLRCDTFHLSGDPVAVRDTLHARREAKRAQAAAQASAVKGSPELVEVQRAACLDEISRDEYEARRAAMEKAAVKAAGGSVRALKAVQYQRTVEASDAPEGALGATAPPIPARAPVIPVPVTPTQGALGPLGGVVGGKREGLGDLQQQIRAARAALGKRKGNAPPADGEVRECRGCKRLVRWDAAAGAWLNDAGEDGGAAHPCAAMNPASAGDVAGAVTA